MITTTRIDPFSQPLQIAASLMEPPTVIGQ